MKSPALSFASVIAMAAFAVSAGATFAAPTNTINASKSNSDYRIGSGDKEAEEECRRKGGIVLRHANGTIICLGAARAHESVTVRGSKSNSDNRSITPRECTAKGGSVWAGEDGKQVCIPKGVVF